VIPPKAAAVVLERAAKKLGDQKRLAEKLGVSLIVLRLYISGVQQCPEEIYLRAVDIVLGESNEGRA
jgi:hypothetical protein